MAGFVCVYYGNTGSSWLVEALGGSPDVLVPGFEPVEPWAWDAPAEERLAWVREALDPPAEREGAAYEAWTAKLAASPQVKGPLAKPGFGLVGFKLNDLAVSHTGALAAALAATGSTAIVLERENRLKHAVSLYRYHEEGKSQFDGRRDRPATTLRWDRFEHWLDQSRRLHELSGTVAAELAGVLGPERVVRVAYEEFVTPAGKRELLDRLGAVLGISGPFGGGSYEKATPDELRSAVANYWSLWRRYRFGPYGGDFTRGRSGGR